MLELIEPWLPDERPDVDLAAALIVRRIAQHRLEGQPRLAERASVHAALGRRLYNAGYYTEAYEATSKAVDDYRQLSEGMPSTYEPELAKALCDLNLELLELRHFDRALEVAKEALNLGRRISSADSVFNYIDLAQAWTCLGVAQGKLDRLEDALSSHKEALRLRREQAAIDVSKLPYAGASLINIGWTLLSAGDFDKPEVIHVYSESVEAYRQAISLNVENCDVGLSRALIILGLLLASPGSQDDDPPDYERAHQLVLEAVVKRQLAAANPIAYERELANALRTLSNVQLMLDQAHQAVTSAEEAAEILRRWPVGHEPLLAETLSELRGMQWQSGDTAQAITTAEEVVAICRELHEATADQPESAARLGQALTALGEMEYECGEMQRALKNTREAVEVLRELTITATSNHSIAFAAAALTLAEVRIAARTELEIVLDVLDEAVGNCLTAQLEDRSGEATLANMINSLSRTKVDALEASGRHEEADQLRRELGEL